MYIINAGLGCVDVIADKVSNGSGWVLVAGLIAVFGHLSYQLWFGASGFRELRGLSSEVRQKESENLRLYERNQLLTAEIIELKSGMDAIEERARNELGMIEQGETFVWIVPE